MAIGLVGRKAGMTRVFTDAGETVPVTVIEVLPNRVTQVKAQDKNGYRAVQVTYGTRRPQLYSKAVNGHYAKANVAPGRALVEFSVNGNGVPTDVVVVASEPPREFEKSARLLVRNLRFDVPSGWQASAAVAQRFRLGVRTERAYSLVFEMVQTVTK